MGAASPVRAQVGERGKITSRSDVKLTIEGAAGTSGSKLSALAEALMQPLGDVQKCYADLISEHPEAAGTLALDVQLPKEGKLAVNAPGATGPLAPMRKCIDKAIAKIDVALVPRPAGAKVGLELTNTAAGSAAEVRRLEESASQVDIQTGDDGVLRSHGEAVQKQVAFDVSGRARADVEEAHKLLRDALPGLFDCRRRASKKSSPKGEIALRMKAGGVIEAGASSVPNERAPTCVVAAIKRIRKAQKPVVDATIHFRD
ncbi:MAG: hypothetical protein ABW252_09645 [Polyangiales bacterium]